MKANPSFFYLAAILACAAVAPIRSQTYQITELAPLGSSTYSRADAINNSGQVGGGSNFGCVLWTNGVPAQVPGAIQVFSMNDAGHMAGQPFNSSIHSTGGYFDGTAMVPIPPPPELWLLYSWSINNSDAIVGQVGPREFQGTTAYLWQNRKFTFLQPLPGDVTSMALAVNDSNVVVGSSQSRTTMTPVRWVAGVPQALGTLDPSDYSSAQSINGAGQIVGDSGESAFIWDDKNGMRPLPTPSGSASHAITINSAGDVLGTIGGNPVVWKNGPQGYNAIVNIADHLPASSGWSNLHITGMNDVGQFCGSGLHNGKFRGFLISSAIPTFETAYVDRDNPFTTWGERKVITDPTTVYAGDGTGDLMGWSVKNAPAGALFKWSAVQTAGLTHATINGPEGAGTAEWRLTDGSFNWPPGTYRINCVVTPAAGSPMTLSADQVVGWRTQEYLVVGQVKPILDYELSVARRLIVDTALATSYMSPRDSYVSAATKLTLLALPTEVNVKIWIGYQYLRYTLSGATSPSYIPLQAINQEDKYWMIQSLLNDYPDLVALPEVLEPENLNELKLQRSYRMFARNQLRYCLDASGRIDPASARFVIKDWDIGPTKFAKPPAFLSPSATMSARGVEFDLQGNSEQSFITGETSPDSGGLFIKAAGTSLSFYVAGRVGLEGRVPNYALIGRDAPFIFAEIITAIGVDGRDTGSRIRLSVNKTWQPNGTVTGDAHFNEIRIYKRDMNEDAFGKFVLTPNGLFEIAGQLPAFLESGSATWPGSAPPPTGN